MADVYRKKRTRTSKFSSEDIETLKILTVQDKIICNNKTDKRTNRMKERAWNRITFRFNACSAVYRTKMQLKNKFALMLKIARKEAIDAQSAGLLSQNKQTVKRLLPTEPTCPTSQDDAVETEFIEIVKMEEEEQSSDTLSKRLHLNPSDVMLSRSDDTFVILGDYNLPSLCWTSPPKGNLLDPANVPGEQSKENHVEFVESPRSISLDGTDTSDVEELSTTEPRTSPTAPLPRPLHEPRKKDIKSPSAVETRRKICMLANKKKELAEQKLEVLKKVDVDWQWTVQERKDRGERDVVEFQEKMLQLKRDGERKEELFKIEMEIKKQTLLKLKIENEKLKMDVIFN